MWIVLKVAKSTGRFSNDTKSRGSRIEESKHTSKKMTSILLQLKYRQFRRQEFDLYFLEEIKESGFKPKSILAIDM